MARKPREEFEGAVHHVYARGNRAERIYEDDQDRGCYLSLLGQEIDRRRWRCLSFCLMTTHVHLLIETPEPNLGAGMQRLHGVYAQTFNERHGRPGHVFQGRYGAVRMLTDEQMLTTIRYIALNPVKAGLCPIPEDWRWSSHSMEAAGVAPSWLDRQRLRWYVGSDPLSGGDSGGLTPSADATQGV